MFSVSRKFSLEAKPMCPCVAHSVIIRLSLWFYECYSTSNMNLYNTRQGSTTNASSLIPISHFNLENKYGNNGITTSSEDEGCQWLLLLTR